MKSNRIFITNDPNDYSEKEFNGIKMEDVIARLASVREASEEAKLPEELRRQVSALNMGNGEEAEATEANERTAKGLPEALKKHQFKAKGEKPEDGGLDGEGEDESDDESKLIKRGKAVKAARTRRLLFNDPSQISAAALRAVEAAGDESLAHTIKAVRNEARQHLAAKLDEQAQRLAEKSNKAAKRNSVRMKIVDNTQTALKLAAKTETEKPIMNEPTRIKELSAADREIAVRKAQLNGWSDNYINAFFGVSNEDSEIAEIKSVMASDLSTNTKIAAVKGMVKIATLDSENVNRLKRYWKEELGYGDEAWIDDLFTTKYDTGKSID